MRAKCLVVEDEPAILRLLTMILEDLECETLAAPDAETALDILENTQPDVIIVDIRLPGMDGLQLARRIRTHPKMGETPILLTSAYGEPPGHDGNDFLAKPFDIDQLADLLESYISA